MSHPDWLTLDPDESVVWTGRPRRRRIVSTVVFAAVWSAGILAFAYAFVHYIPPVLDRAEIAPARYVWAVAWVLVGLWVAFVPIKFLGMTTTEYALTDRDLYARSGGFSESVTRVPVDEIRNTTIHTGFFGNHMEYGTVRVDAGGPGTDVALRGLESPGHFRETLRSLERSDDDSVTGGTVDEDARREGASETSGRSDGADPQ